MDRYRVRASLNNHHLLSPPLHSSTKISLPPRPSITSYLPTHHTTNKDREVDTTTELSIFDAERYFKESQLPTYTKVNTTTNSSTLINEDNNSSSSTVSSTWRDRSFRATPTASSEASWNSQSGLLIKPHSGSVFLSVRPKSFPFPSNEKIKSNRSRAPNTKSSSSSSPSPTSFPASSRRFFSRNCSCYGRKSVAVAVEESESKSPVRLTSAKATTQTESDHRRNLSVENVGAVEKLPVAKMKISPGTWYTESSTQFPTDSERGPKKSLPPQQPHRILNSAVFSFQVLQQPPPPPSGVDDPSRDSLEVFRPADEPPNLRRLTDTQRRHVSFVGGGANADDDVASDASSELFEIESLSTQPAAYRRRDSLDELPKLTGSTAAGMLDFRRSLEETEASIAPSECYPPSEVSVQWSVTTAEGGSDRASLANFSSAASDVYDEIRFIEAAHDRFGATMIARSAGGGMKKVAGGLLSCRCENAVDVGPIPVKITPELRRPAVISVEPDRLQVISRFPLDKAEL